MNQGRVEKDHSPIIHDVWLTRRYVFVQFPPWPGNWGCNTRMTIGIWSIEVIIILGFSKGLERDRASLSTSARAAEQSFGGGFIQFRKSGGGPSCRRTLSCSSELDRVLNLHGNGFVILMPEGSLSQTPASARSKTNSYSIIMQNLYYLLILVLAIPTYGFQVLTEEDLQEIQQRELLYRTMVDLELLGATLARDLRKTGMIWDLKLPSVGTAKDWKFSNSPNPIFSGEYWSFQVFEDRIEAFCFFNDETGDPAPYGFGDVEVKYVYKINENSEEKADFFLFQIVVERGIDWVTL